MFLEAKQHRGGYERQSYRLQNTKQGRADYLEGKMKEAKFN